MTVENVRGRTPFGTLLRVETRKLLDTRTSRILTGILVLLTLVLLVGRGLAVQGTADLFTLAGTVTIVLGVLLPVLGILTITGEWSHRTALTTFTLEPRRGRVLAAKCVPVLVAAVAACLLALLVAVPVTAVAASVQGVQATWGLAPAPVLGWVATMVLTSAQGLALGMMLLNAPAAIVIYLVAPMALSFAGQLGTAGRTMADWLAPGAAGEALADGSMTGADAARLLTSAMVWIVIPVAIGVSRILRKDVH
ncbi:hypothetical protein AB0I81_01220 [Nonomuraea sp. NPDC050404]|uniref:hypothetical protein n=1 Tax=Nonomuraea sp. NPDC050404 TaxID=3155783 RepID=UPI0033D1C4C0